MAETKRAIALGFFDGVHIGETVKNILHPEKKDEGTEKKEEKTDKK